MTTWRTIAMGVAMLIQCPCWAALDAEYAVRWEEAQGGPKSLTEIASMLGLKDYKEQMATVGFFAVKQCSVVPEGFKLIARERVFKKKKGDAPEVMLKLRGPVTPGTDPTVAWVCPLPKADKSKVEVDISWTGSDMKKSLSRSCSQEDESALKIIPKDLAPVAPKCRSEMQRFKGKDLTIERWTLGDRRIVYEVSMSGQDDGQSEQRFKKVVLQALPGIRPLSSGMTDIATQAHCP